MTNSPLFIGMHVTGQLLRGALIDGTGKILERREAAISPENTIERAATVAADLGARGGNVSAIGFAIPGLVNRQTDVVMVSPELPTTIREGLHSDLMRATGL